MVSNDLDQRGKELRVALQRAFQRLADSDGLSTGIHGTDITNVVLPYIPVGTAFTKAETVLRDAGFVVGPRPKPESHTNPNRPKDWCAVIATISPFAQKLFAKIDLYVSLLPKSPEDYTDVSKVTATLYISAP